MQFGQRFSSSVAHEAHQVHSKLQIRASVLSPGNWALQRSQTSRISSIEPSKAGGWFSVNRLRLSRSRGHLKERCCRTWQSRSHTIRRKSFRSSALFVSEQKQNPGWLSPTGGFAWNCGCSRGCEELLRRLVHRHHRAQLRPRRRHGASTHTVRSRPHGHRTCQVGGQGQWRHRSR